MSWKEEQCGTIIQNSTTEHCFRKLKYNTCFVLKQEKWAQRQIKVHSVPFYGMENLLNLRLTNYRKTIFK
jgi:hypothetical protein